MGVADMSDTKAKIGVAIIHGIGQQTPDFCQYLIDNIKDTLPRIIAENIAFQPIHWSPVLNDREIELRNRIMPQGIWNPLHKFIIEFLADAVAYPPSRKWVYRKVHKVFADGLMELEEKTVQDAPLCIISHSLGTIIASNFIWDIQQEDFSAYTINPKPDQTLARGKTMNLFYTMGSPLGLWSLLHGDIDDPSDPIFGTPIAVPHPKWTHRGRGMINEWVNFYERDDVISYPIKRLNHAYEKVVQDREIYAGRRLGISGVLPHEAHSGYWDDDEVIKPIAKSLEKTWENLHGFD
ncbi:MAG: hypothetical protein Phog2KO_12350 [Phototrophicaceae bacterium]